MFSRRVFLQGSAVGLAGLGVGCAPRPAGPATTGLIRDLQERSFRYFWETADAATGLVPDRWPTPSFASIAAIGFALTAYPIGVANGWITRSQARARTLTTLEFLASAPQNGDAVGASGYNGLFYHFLGAGDGRRSGMTELSTIDTALLLGGVLFAQSWFDTGHPDERRIRMLADQLYAAVDWRWITPRAPLLSMGWSPEEGFIPHDWNAYNEAMLLHVLAIGSPTHPLPPETWDHWSAAFERSWSAKWGQPHLAFPPLFGHQYSHVWIDFRGIRDRFIATKGIDYFENSRRATYAQRDYAIANPNGWAGYGENIWGLTACDGPGDFTATIGGRPRQFYSYSARGPEDRDDGTLAPTAAAGSIVFAPEIVVPALETMHRDYGAALYGRYGFLDAFNPSLTDPSATLKHGRIAPGIGWVDGDYLGIDQGPIVAMIENWRTGLVWKTMRGNPHIRRGLQRAGFTGGWLG